MRFYAFPDYLDNHELSYLNHIDPYLQQWVKSGAIEPQQARLLNFQGVCALLQSGALGLAQVAEWNYRQARAMHVWTQKQNPVPFETMLAYIEMEELYNKFCFLSIFDLHCAGLFDLSQIATLTEYHCLTIIRNAENITALIPAHISVEDFLNCTIEQLQCLERLSQQESVIFINAGMQLEAILTYLVESAPQHTKLPTPNSIDLPTDDDLQNYYDKLDRTFCSNASNLLKMKVVSLELSFALTDSDWLAISAWYELPNRCDYEEILTKYPLWSNVSWHRYSCGYRFAYVDKFITENELANIETTQEFHLELAEFMDQYYDAILLPLLDSKIITVKRFLALEPEQLLNLAILVDDPEIFTQLLAKDVSFLDVVGPSVSRGWIEMEEEEKETPSVEQESSRYSSKKRRREALDESREDHSSIQESLAFTLFKQKMGFATLPDGNCAFNAIVLFMRELFLTQGQTLETAHFSALLCAHPVLVEHNIVTEEQLRALFQEKDPIGLQKLLAPVLRLMVVDDMRNPQNHYQDLLWERLNMAIMYHHHNPLDSNIPEADTFLVHDFIKNKWMEGKVAANGNMPHLVSNMQHWWIAEGFEQYLNAIAISAQAVNDVARWGSSLELTVLQQRFQFCVKLTNQNNGFEYLGDPDSSTICKMHIDGDHWSYVGMQARMQLLGTDNVARMQCS